jgi:hypothetical protein
MRGVSVDEARAAINAGLRGQPAPQERVSVPAAVSDATNRLRQAIASSDAEEIVAADDALTSAIDGQAGSSLAPVPRVYDWGQGARGTGAGRREVGMNERLRSASSPLDPAHGTGSIE